MNDHSRMVRTTSSTPVLPAVILKKGCSTGLFEGSIKRDQFEFLSETVAEAENIIFSLIAIRGFPHVSLRFLASGWSSL